MLQQIKLKFTDQQYQEDAVNSIVNIFKGQEIKDSIFTISSKQDQITLFNDVGYANILTILDSDILTNIREIQEKNNIQKIQSLSEYGRNFTIEMETGTGKTYVYTKTILELNKRYGWTKFIIVVPSVAIKEGVKESLDNTKEHFSIKYNNIPYDYYTYDSNNISKIKTFANSNNIQIMIMTIGSFNKSIENQDSEDKANLIFRDSDQLDGWKGIDLIRSTNPIVIIDEPQSVDNTPKAKKAIASLNPLFILRYSATHKELYNLMYRLTPVDAFRQHLVKEIWVNEISADDQTTKPYIKLISVSGEGGADNKARIEIFKKDKKTGSIDKKAINVKTGDDIWELSNELDYYNSNQHTINDIDCTPDNENILLSNGDVLKIGEAIGLVDDEHIKRAQIRETIIEHLKKERKYLQHGIKVLSLIFIDKVENYRLPDGSKGKYAVWFEEEYKNLINGTYSSVKEQYSQVNFDPELVHNGYFSTDGKGRLKNTKGDGKEDDTTYNLIMKEKGKLLSLSEPTKFIFSHSALKEGWDNPNVFQVCTLVDTKDTFTKRQKIGRGLRICVNQNGDRVLDNKFNVLNVIANESYKHFCSTLQKEYSEQGYKFGIIDPIAFTGLTIEKDNGSTQELTQEDSIAIHKILVDKGYIKNNKTTTKYYQDKQNHIFKTNDQYLAFDRKVEDKIDFLSFNIMPKNARERVKINRNNKVINSEVFQEIWNKINRKTIYSVNLDTIDMIEKAAQYIREMPTISKQKISSKHVKVDVDKSGVKARDTSVIATKLANISDFEQIHYPDFVRRLTDSTELLRKTIITILSKADRFEDFYNNPEEFLKVASKLINKAKLEKLANGIKYTPINEYYKQEEIFDDTEFYGIKDSNVVDVSSPDKNIFDHVIFDSEIEKAFAKECDMDDEVALYAKLPAKFTIDTPYGTYNPDWMVVLKQETTNLKMYFVAETKGTTDIDQLAPMQTNKILCGRKHFEVLDSNLKYEVVKRLIDLKQSGLSSVIADKLKQHK